MLTREKVTNDPMRPEIYDNLAESGRTLLGTPPALLSPSLLLGGGVCASVGPHDLREGVYTPCLREYPPSPYMQT